MTQTLSYNDNPKFGALKLLELISHHTLYPASKEMSLHAELMHTPHPRMSRALQDYIACCHMMLKLCIM